MTRPNDGSSATSTVSGTFDEVSLDTRVHNSTLSGAGSPEATPSAKTSGASLHDCLDRFASVRAHTMVAPSAAAALMNSRLFTSGKLRSSEAGVLNECDRAARVIHPGIFRHIDPGFERIAPGFNRPRHAHLSAYVSIVLEGSYEQASYAGRMRIEPGDILIQPVLDRHESRAVRARELHLLRLAWFAEPGVGGVYRSANVDLVIRTARHDPRAASGLLEELLKSAAHHPAATRDWPDLLAEHMRTGGTQLTSWARAHRLSRETVSRGFVRTYGVAPRAFAAEFKAREAWIRIVSGQESLAAIAGEVGYADQPHMTRAVRALTGAPPDAWRRRLSLAAPTLRTRARTSAAHWLDSGQ